ncbi:MAG: hypothetical protein ACTSPY_10225 [Candidatus Helarchaeota archaeon]
MSAINYIISRPITTNWGDTLELNNKVGETNIMKLNVKEFKNMMPKKINNLLLSRDNKIKL